MTLDELNRRFLYVTDKVRYGVEEYWNPLEESDGNLYGDCESYAITLKREVPLFEDWNYYWCRMNGDGHCILVSPCGSMMIDNNTRNVTLLSQYERLYTITELRPFKWYELLWKFGSAKVLSIWFKIKG
jgi:predicted transglutaminase-like cysteine proteinase